MFYSYLVIKSAKRKTHWQMPKILCAAYAFKDNPCDERNQILQESCNITQSLHDACKNITRYQSRQKNKLGYKSCKNLASRLQVVCIPFQDCLKDCCKILNSSKRRETTRFRITSEQRHILVHIKRNERSIEKTKNLSPRLWRYEH